MVNDISIITGIITIFIFLGITVPYINAEYGTQANEVNVEGFESELAESADSSMITLPSILISIISMFFWTFGALPFWLDGIFLIFRIILGITIARNVWIGGGG